MMPKGVQAIPAAIKQPLSTIFVGLFWVPVQGPWEEKGIQRPLARGRGGLAGGATLTHEQNFSKNIASFLCENAVSGMAACAHHPFLPVTGSLTVLQILLNMPRFSPELCSLAVLSAEQISDLARGLSSKFINTQIVKIAGGQPETIIKALGMHPEVYLSS